MASIAKNANTIPASWSRGIRLQIEKAIRNLGSLVKFRLMHTRMYHSSVFRAQVLRKKSEKIKGKIAKIKVERLKFFTIKFENVNHKGLSNPMESFMSCDCMT